MFFIVMLVATTFCIAASAAFFSVFGMMQTYSAIAIPILIMGASLELGKLMTASVLYRMWDKLKSLKYYLMAAVLGLMLMTSLGIFGYLTAGYQKDSVPIQQINQKLDTDKQEIDRLIARKKEIDQQIAKLPSNYVKSRQQLMGAFDAELKTIAPRIDALQTEIGDYQGKKIDTEAHIGPIIFVAKVLGRDPDEAVTWFTLLIMSVFDPLAVALTLATNIAIKQRQEAKVVEDQKEPYIYPIEPAYERYPDNETEPLKSDSVDIDGHAEPSPYTTGIVPHVDSDPIPDAATEGLTKEDVVEIVKTAIENEDLQSLKKRQEILNELRK